MELIYFSIAYLGMINLLAFITMGIDKHQARHNRWRIKETTLFLPVFLGGGLGGILGMRYFHHKTRHWYFKYGFWLITLAQVGIGLYLIGK